jgi:hypothetical protein
MASHRPHARHQPPDHSKGDESTIGGYMAVHDRPAAFEGSDGFSYSVEIMTDDTGERAQPWGAFFLFVKWSRIGAQTPEGHLESEYLVRGSSEDEARRRLGALSLGDVKELLDRLIRERDARGDGRRWWDAMRDDDQDSAT